ncbi:MAG: MmgE/PrpD family protein [Chloroflexi bacterium]|nr:MmgE/PrpD family protein [Chloroflexota bacterium]
MGESPLSTPSRQLADFVANFRFEDLPEHARERTRAIFLDAIGCALAGHEGDETGQIEAVATALGWAGEQHRDRRRKSLTRWRNAAEWLPDHRGHGVRRAPGDPLPHRARSGTARACHCGAARPIGA